MSQNTGGGVSTPEAEPAAPAERGPDGLPVQDANGVDLTLIRAMLALSPLDRLRQAETWMRQLSVVRRVPPPTRP